MGYAHGRAVSVRRSGYYKGPIVGKYIISLSSPSFHSPYPSTPPRIPGTLCRPGIYQTFCRFLASETLLSPLTAVHMTYSPSESNWKPPPVDRIVCNVDRIYSAGLFWRVVSPQLLERQSRLMSAIASMTEKLKAALPPHDQPLQEKRQRRYPPPLDF